jgi:hypothetical protein
MFDPAAFALPSGIGEKRYFEFRSQATDALNHFNPGFPNTTIGSPVVSTFAR